jgi:hypothetical protein
MKSAYSVTYYRLEKAAFYTNGSLVEIIVRLGQIIIPLAPHGISKNEILSILFYSFHNVFRKRQARYPNLVHHLQYVLNRYNAIGKSSKI